MKLNLKKLREISENTPYPLRGVDYCGDDCWCIAVEGPAPEHDSICGTGCIGTADGMFLVEARNNWEQLIDALEEARNIIKKRAWSPLMQDKWQGIRRQSEEEKEAYDWLARFENED